MSDHRVRFECNDCGYACSGDPEGFGIIVRVENHEKDNPGHEMFEVES